MPKIPETSEPLQIREALRLSRYSCRGFGSSGGRYDLVVTNVSTGVPGSIIFSHLPKNAGFGGDEGKRRASTLF